MADISPEQRRIHYLRYKEANQQKRLAKIAAETPEERAARLAHKLEVQKAYAARHPDRIKARNDKYHAENGDSIREQQKGYYAENREARNASSAAYHVANRDRLTAAMRARHADNRDEDNAAKRATYHADLDASRAKAKAYREANAEKVREWARRDWEKNREARIADARARYREDPTAHRAASKRWAEMNPDRVQANLKKWREENASYARDRYRDNLQYRMAMVLRARLQLALRRTGNPKIASAVDLVGCTPAELVAYIEQQFEEGMTWDNYGEWHVDHIRQVATFDLSDLGDQMEAFHYSNLRPLWATENLARPRPRRPGPK